MYFFFFNKFYLFIYFWLCWVFVAARRPSPVVASGGHSSLWWACFSLWWLLPLQSMGSRCVGLSSWDTRAQQLWLAGSRAQAQQLWCTGLAALRHVGSSRTRAWTCVPCIGRQIPNHCATREVQYVFLLIYFHTFSWIFIFAIVFIYNNLLDSIRLPLTPIM